MAVMTASPPNRREKKPPLSVGAAGAGAGLEKRGDAADAAGTKLV